MDTIDDRVRQVVSEELGVRPENIGLDASLADLGADSTDRLSLTLALEDEFGIEIPDADGKDLDTVRALSAYIAAHAGTATA